MAGAGGRASVNVSFAGPCPLVFGAPLHLRGEDYSPVHDVSLLYSLER